MDEAYEAERIGMMISVNSREAFRFTKSVRNDTLDDRVVELELQMPGRFDYRWTAGGFPWQESEDAWSPSDWTT